MLIFIGDTAIAKGDGPFTKAWAAFIAERGTHDAARRGLAGANARRRPPVPRRAVRVLWHCLGRAPAAR